MILYLLNAKGVYVRVGMSGVYEQSVRGISFDVLSCVLENQMFIHR